MMRKIKITRRITQVLVRFVMLVGLATIQPAFANQLSQYTAQRVQQAHADSLNGKLDEAISRLESISTSQEYDQAFVARMLGAFYWQNDQPDNAINALKFSVDSGVLSKAQHASGVRMLADLYLSEEKYKKAIHYYHTLVETEQTNQPERALIWLRISQSYYQLEQWEDVLSSVERYQRSGGILDVSALSLRLGAQLQRERWDNASETLERLVELDPNNSRWWQQWVSVELRKERVDNALTILTLSKLQGIETNSQQLTLLAQLYANQNMPAKAAESLALLDDALTNVGHIVRQAQFLQQAKHWEESVRYWQLAAEIEKQYHWQKKYHWNAAQLLLSQREFQRVLDEMSNIPNADLSVSMLSAMTQSAYQLSEFDLALTFAIQAEKQEPTEEHSQWVNYLNNRIHQKPN
ncbi:tetratricopeptide repeat protein [Vibrio genomosp. F10]|uniref:tetratricopeptide repeat protein n=1 Tax=Vibrio genomosp. F10 TaxID=723171 RepID=UPI00036E2BDF|nr:hypothetical protein [Vibrio genomosp. F10]OEE94909.1 hypothetical protein A1QK_16025 [Vibrio genomosp. F10 str. 9ZD137]